MESTLNEKTHSWTPAQDPSPLSQILIAKLSAQESLISALERLASEPEFLLLVWMECLPADSANGLIFSWGAVQRPWSPLEGTIVMSWRYAPEGSFMLLSLCFLVTLSWETEWSLAIPLDVLSMVPKQRIQPAVGWTLWEHVPTLIFSPLLNVLGIRHSHRKLAQHETFTLYYCCIEKLHFWHLNFSETHSSQNAI